MRRKKTSSSGVSIVIPVSSTKYIDYLANCFAALEAQKGCKDRIEVIVSISYCKESSEYPVQVDPFVSLAYQYDHVFGFSLVMVEHDLPEFPVALARNAGARRAQRRIVGFVDADIVLHPGTLRAVRKIIGDEEKAAYSPVHRMRQGPQSPIYEQFEVSDFVENRKNGSIDAAAKGGCFFIERDLLFEMRGYDERLWGWGFEDDDMVRRLHMNKTPPVNLGDKGLAPMHQFHRHRGNYKRRWYKNKEIALNSDSMVRNKGSWGGLLD
jgi:glycosyltransferase involved in cell wall biosynthesis